MKPSHTGRGQYDRTQSSRRRRRETRSRIIQAAAQVLAAAKPNPPNVRLVTDLAGVGRNTFYVHFRDGRELQRATERVATRQIGRLLARDQEHAVTPIEKLRALAHAWTDCANLRTPLSDVAVGRCVGDPTPPAVQLLERRLAVVLDEARKHSVIAGTPTELRISMVALAWHRAAGRVTAGNSEASEIALDLVDFTLRVFR